MVKIADHSTVIYGTHFPNRIFVGCLPQKATAQDLAEFFSYFGTVNEAKVVLDENGCSKRFGFVSFGNGEDVKCVLKQGSIFFWGKKINVGPAVKKKFYDDVKGQPATLVFDQAMMSNSNKSHVVYQPMDSFQLQTANPTSNCLAMDFQPWPCVQIEEQHQMLRSENLSRIYPTPFCSTLPTVPSPLPSIMPSQPYQIAPQTISNPPLAYANVISLNSNPVCGKYPCSVPVSQSCILPMVNFNPNMSHSMQNTAEKVIAMTQN